MIGGVMMVMLGTSFVPTVVKTSAAKPKVTQFKYLGDIQPVGYFDPLELTSKENVKEETIGLIRESELQHGRVAMLAATLMPLLEVVQHDKLAINCLSGMTGLMQVPFWLGLLAYEYKRMKVGWENPFGADGAKPFSLKKNYQPGNVFNYDMTNISDKAINSELSNGRLAMIAAMHMVAYEYYTGHSFLPSF